MTPKRTKTVVLKPCPFCGDRSGLRWPSGSATNWVVCLNVLCNAYGPNGRTEKEAIAAWNRRTNRKGKK